MADQAPQTDWNHLDDEEFRRVAAEFFATHVPRHLRFLSRRPRWSEVKEWYLTLSARGWLMPNWPKEWGGMGLTQSKILVYLEELERSGAPRVMDQGQMNIGPLLIARGTDEQRARFLPKILSGEHTWCQGYSEPNAGSDLASLRTEARIEGDEFVINGQKIWTSVAFDATHMFALVRTDKTVKKQAGISFVMIDMRQPGVTVRPIRNIAGHEELCEVFLDNVRTPKANMVGKLNDGWNVAKALLGFERIWSGSPRQSMLALLRLQKLAKASGKMADPAFVDKFTQVTMDVLDSAAAYERFAQIMRTGGSFGFEVSMLKIWATETCQRVTELMVDAAGDLGALGGDVDVDGQEMDILYPFLECRAFTIYGGSSQVQRNILAKNVLDLPS
ncbi:acyl-CoA dehydrogenase [Alicycliphilus denitrificans]|uniref:Acyl-CoA dehydrogenase domain-containing protein n=2 Tax=Alicycliphilus denitrificans TaxID=179636 RepID=F4GB67_ALIDK|nr:acyl-CoA dehydrogenase family protein [Alicycliphilus denitrificans]ADV01015.1 acyl-CoA dehydrogenase domain-containing protein [Alicycliphilus denitrificans BC]AEB83558.1 acyl-CoA dehydrogenase domain-containing protein [Alicycliphilus denitrificans K601]QKD45168.1 acyl-CoA dehydrogenase [Alicycliphilus denitrificans]GAO24610.1 acyl-CoA dehydrogenase domain-containing protein [Alicycliphilus sp. B1]